MDNETNVFPDFKPQTPMFDTGDPQPKPEKPAAKKRTRKADAPKPAKVRKPRGPRRTMPVSTAAAEPAKPVAPKKARKPRTATRETQVAISLLPALIGLKPEELSFVLQVGDAFKALGKKARVRVAAALQRMCQ